MIDANGKLFGKISIVDLIVVLAVLIAMGGIYVRFYGGPTKTVVQNSTFYYTMSVKNIRASNRDALLKSIGGNFYLNEKITGDMGKLIDAETLPADTSLEKVTGEIITAKIPERYDMILTFEMNGKVNDRGYFSPSLEDISAGIAYNIKGKYSAVTGTIQSVSQ